MRIGLLTYHSATNFGANLQALSTVSYLKNNGHEVIVINWVPEDLEGYYKKNVSSDQVKVHDDFVKRYFTMSELCRTSKDVRSVIEKFNLECIIIGSDAVFSYIPFLKRIHLSRKTFLGIKNVTSDHKFPNPFWADFLYDNDKFKVVAMSASAQYLDFSKCFWWTKNQLRKHLGRFSHITVRDRYTKKLVDTLLNTSVNITPDPVFSFNVNFSQFIDEEVFRARYGLPEKYVVLSFCNLLYPSDWYESLYQIFKKNGYLVVNLAMPEGCVEFKADIKIDTPLDPLDWYNIIRFSSGYIGQRMHPMIVALHNLVPVYIFDHYVVTELESSKIYDLLERFDLKASYYNVKTKILPNVNEVYNAINNFDVMQLKRHVDTMAEKYLDMMKTLIK